MMRPDYMDMLGSNLGNDRQPAQGGQWGNSGASKVPPKRNPQEPAPKGYGGSGLEDFGGNMPFGKGPGGILGGPYGPPHPQGGPVTDTFGGAGGPMPIPDGGPGWRRNAGDQTGGGGGPMPIPDGGPNWRNVNPIEDSGFGGFNPMGNSHGFSGDQMGGGGGPMPMPPPWKGRNPEDFGVTMEFGGPGAINPPGMGPQDLRNFYHPTPSPVANPAPAAPQQPQMFNRPRQMQQFRPHGLGGMGGGRIPQWQNAMGNSPQGRMDFLNKLKQSYNGGQGFKWNF